MRLEIIAAITIAAAAAMGARVFDHLYSEGEAPPPAQERAAASEPAPRMAVARAGWGREIRIKVSRDQHYYVDAMVNRAPAKFLIDTGASFVALRDTDAHAAGIYINPGDYTYPVRTANGETMAAMVTIDEIDIEGLRVDGVKAFVLKDDQLAVNLLGMSFLSRLESVEARAGVMMLRG